VDDDGRFFRRNEGAGGIAANLADHLLVTRHVQGIARLHGGELLIEIASAGQVAGLNRGVSQQLDDFRQVSGLSRFLKEIEKFLERGGIITYVSDDRVKVL